MNIFNSIILTATGGFGFHPEMFVKNLSYMGTGMLCIFIVIGVIIGVVALLDKVTGAIENKRKK